MIERCFDAQKVSGIYGKDTSALVDDHRNIILLKDRNIGVFAWRGPGIFEGHIHFEAKGRAAIKIAKAMLDVVPAKIIWGLTPASFKHVRWFNRKIGFKSQGILKTPEGRHELFVLEK